MPAAPPPAARTPRSPGAARRRTPPRRAEVERLRDRVARLERAVERLSARPPATAPPPEPAPPPFPVVFESEEDAAEFDATMRELRAQDPPGGLLEEGEQPDPEKVREIVAWAEERRAAAARARGTGRGT